MKSIAIATVVILSTVAIFAQNEPVIKAKHMELPTYPRLARFARLQGTVSVHLKVSQSGLVTSAEANASEQVLRDHPLLQSETLKVVRKWTFNCINCEMKTEYEHTLVFVYKLEGKETSSDASTITIDMPDSVTITANPQEPLG